MYKKALAGSLAIATAVATSACTGTQPIVQIETFIVKDAGPYTIKIDAYDNTDHKQLYAKEEPVVGVYGPAAVTYPSGHKVDVTVRIELGGGKFIPLSSYIRLQDGGLGAKKKTCSPFGEIKRLECNVGTRF